MGAQGNYHEVRCRLYGGEEKGEEVLLPVDICVSALCPNQKKEEHLIESAVSEPKGDSQTYRRQPDNKR